MKLLLFLALLPGFVIIYQVYHLDKIEKEPMGLLFRLLLGGALVTIPIIIAELAFESRILSLFPYGLVYLLYENFIGVALIEELGKYIILKLVTWKNKNFDYMFDGVVYAVCASMGFALVENVLYVLDGGISLALIRAMISVPGHAVFGVFMGIFYSYAKQAYNEGENVLSKQYLALAVIVPTIFHGFFDFLLSYESDILFVVFLVFICALYLFTYKKLKRMSKSDRPNEY